MTRPRHWLRAGFNIALVAGLLTAASFLPPDTSLADVQRTGTLKFCVPTSFPPLVTGDPARPGYDVDLAQAIAGELGLRLTLNVLPSIGKDYNPRNWFLTRAQCDIVGGGVADTVQTRSFMQTIPTRAETGWVGISSSGAIPASGSVVAVLPGTTGLDRLALSSWLRQQQLTGQVVRDANQLALLLESGGAAAGITESFTSAGLGLPSGKYQSFWLDESIFPRFTMALGMWKGDQTLKRAIQQAFKDLDQSGFVLVTQRKYGLAPAASGGPETAAR